MLLLIFDIDGTLTHLDGATRRAFDAAYMRVFGMHAEVGSLALHGRTDPVIFQDLHRLSGLPGDREQDFARFKDVYLEELPAAIAGREKARVLPGVVPLLEELARRPEQVALALGTGNMEAGARTKIGYFGLNHYFPCGGFGDVHLQRFQILEDAVQNAEAHYNCSFVRSESWVLGDTPLDIEGARQIGAKALGVATGGAYSYQDLVDAGADVVMHDFSDTSAVLQALGLNVAAARN